MSKEGERSNKTEFERESFFDEGDLINHGTSERNHGYRALKVLEQATFTSYEEADEFGQNVWDALSDKGRDASNGIPAGTVLRPNSGLMISKYQLSGGVVQEFPIGDVS